MRLVSLIAALILFPWFCTGQSTPSQRPPISDMHLHALPANFFGKVGASLCAGDREKLFPAIDPRTEVSPEQLESCPMLLVAPDTDAKIM